jgi:hypothetical protein
MHSTNERHQNQHKQMEREAETTWLCALERNTKRRAQKMYVSLHKHFLSCLRFIHVSHSFAFLLYCVRVFVC